VVTDAGKAPCIKKLNDELSEKGYLVIQGKTSKKYFCEKLYGEVGTS